MLVMVGQPRIHVVVGPLVLAAAIAVLLAGCGTSSMTKLEGSRGPRHGVRTLVVAPTDTLFANDSRLLGSAVGAELAKRGYRVIEADQASEMLAKRNIPAVDVLNPSGLAALGEGGVDGVLVIDAKGSPMGGSGMRHVTAKVISTSTSGMVVGIAWRNSWGGMPGSPADLMMRKGLNDAAKEIADAVATELETAGK